MIMEKMKKFIKDNINIILIILMTMIFMNHCSIKKQLKKIEDTNIQAEKNLDLKIKIEGLKSEKRAIQASDRKILDVQRQYQIDNEINILQNLIK
jgi:hypothetical protein